MPNKKLEPDTGSASALAISQRIVMLRASKVKPKAGF